MKQRLSERVKLRVVYEDETPLGSTVSGRSDATVRSLCENVASFRAQHGLPEVVLHSRELLLASRIGELYEGPGRIRSDFLYPPFEMVRPVALAVRTPDRSFNIPTPTAELAQWIGDWSRGEGPPANGPARALWDVLEQIGAIDTEPPLPRFAPEAEATFVGHATVALHGDAPCSLIVDPTLYPRAPRYPEDYQPLRPSELDPGAVFITHSHADHFDLGDLLIFGADTPIFVPQVDRESLLAVDMAARLLELGFRRVRTLRWHDEVSAGGFRVIALPFFGEQPAWGERFHREVRNVGNTYLFEREGRRIHLSVDSGTDIDGDARAFSIAARAKYGPLDVLFGGYRGFPVYPIQYLFSSVARHLLFVPEESWDVRQKCMADEEELLDIAEGWGARLVVPYADGGAPWHWEGGLGAVFAKDAIHSLVDPPPERVVEKARVRSGVRGVNIPSPCRVLLMRPGDSIALPGTIVRSAPHAWPYEPSSSITE